MSKNRQQVFQNFQGGWSVKSNGASRAAKNFDSEKDALLWARSKCKRQGLELAVHNRDGSVRYMHTYKKQLAEPK